MRPRGLKFPPANPRRWPAARAASLVWRLRAVPRTHGSRAALGLRPAGYYGLPARSSLTDEVQALTAKRGPGPVAVSRRRWRSPQVERREASALTVSARAIAARHGIWMRLSALRSPHFARGARRKRARPAPEIQTPGRLPRVCTPGRDPVSKLWTAQRGCRFGALSSPSRPAGSIPATCKNPPMPKAT